MSNTKLENNYFRPFDFKVTGSGIYLPKRLFSAEDLDRLVKRPIGWTRKHAGVIKRHWIDSETQSEMGALAAQKALDEAGLKLGDVDILICASGTPEQPIPCTASRILSHLDNESVGTAAYDVNATCLSFLVALNHAAQALALDKYQRILIVSSEIASKGLNFDQPESAVLMGDGAAAVILEKSEKGSRILDFQMKTFSSGVKMAELRGGGSRIHPGTDPFVREDFLFTMDGKKLFRLVSKHLQNEVEGLFLKHSIGWDDIKAVIPHQASKPAMALLCSRLKIPPNKVIDILSERGNVIAASLPMAYHELRRSCQLASDDKLLFIGTSAGVSIATMLMCV